MGVVAKRKRDGYIDRTVRLPADLDRRLAHHARAQSISLDAILRTGAIKACRALDELEQRGDVIRNTA